MTKSWFVSIFFIALLVMIAAQTLIIISPFFHPIFWSGLLAYTFYPLHERLCRAIGGRRNISAFLMTLAILVIVIPILFTIIFRLFTELGDFVQLTVNFVRGGGLEAWIEKAQSWKWWEKLLQEKPELRIIQTSLSDWALTSARNAGNFAVDQVGKLTKNLFVFAAGGLLSLVFIFVFLRDGEGIYRYIYDIAPLHDEDKEAVFGRITETFSAVIRGQIVSALTQAVVAGLIFAALGLPVPILGAALTFLTALIPIAGAAAIWGPYTAYLFAQDDPTRGWTLLVLGVFVISLIDNFIKPALIGEKTKLPFFLLFIVILGGLKIYGISGIFLGPVVVALFFALVKIYQEKFL